MNRINDLIERFFPTQRPLPAGVYHYQAPADAANPYRLHLRIEEDGSGVLILNASTILHLNHTAAEYAYYLVQGTKDSEIIDQVTRRYRVSREQAQADYQQLQEKLALLTSSTDLDPVTFLDMDRLAPYSRTPTAPYRLDCALTYRTSSGDQTAAPAERVRRELQTAEWKTILQKAWDAGIPHVIFTGGEPTLRDDLVELITYAESLGQVSGVLTDGSRLSERELLHRLLQSGLDHIMIVLNPDEEQTWEALRDTLAEDIFVTVHLTITHHNQANIQSLLERLAQMGVKAVSLSVYSEDLKDALKAARETAASLALTLVWDLPVPYSSLNPVSLEVGEHEELTAGEGRAWLYVEPDGDVLPAQGHAQVLGNLLSGSWESVWKK